MIAEMFVQLGLGTDNFVMLWRTVTGDAFRVFVWASKDTGISERRQNSGNFKMRAG